MAFAIFITFLILAVGGRVALQYKMTGDHGIRPTNHDSTTISKFSSGLLLAAFISIFSLTLLNTVGMLEPQFEQSQTLTIAGTIISLAGIALTVISQYQMGTAWRIGVDETEKTELITKGIYSRIRNPIYSGVILFCIGLFLLLPHVYVLLCLAIGYLSIELHVRYVEEPHLSRLHGNAFTQYVNHSGRYFPRLPHGT